MTSPAPRRPRKPRVALDLSMIDPGIRRTVAWLNTHGFRTTDSGDGASKFDPTGPYYWPDADECGVSRVPHVIIQVTPEQMVATADRLYTMLLKRDVVGVSSQPETLDEALSNQTPSVQASYCPGEAVPFAPFENYSAGEQPQRIAIVMLIGVDDALMFDAQRAPTRSPKRSTR